MSDRSNVQNQRASDNVFAYIQKPYTPAPLSEAVEIQIKKGVDLDPLDAE